MHGGTDNGAIYYVWMGFRDDDCQCTKFFILKYYIMCIYSYNYNRACALRIRRVCIWHMSCYNTI